jgi:hypothetical protein
LPCNVGLFACLTFSQTNGCDSLELMRLTPSYLSTVRSISGNTLPCRRYVLTHILSRSCPTLWAFQQRG